MIVGGLLQARMKSTRLRGKMLMDVMDKPVLSYLIERVKRSKLINVLVMATTNCPEDDEIVALCHRHGIGVFRGDEHDVLGRITGAARANGIDVAVRLSGDNPLIDPAIIDKVTGYYLDHRDQFDYVSNNHPPTYPCGQEVEVIPFALLEDADRNAKASHQREHGTPYIWEQLSRYRIGNVEFHHNVYNGEKWDLDYAEDFEFIKAVLTALYPQKPDFDMFDVLRLLEERPEIRQINAMHVGYHWSKMDASESGRR